MVKTRVSCRFSLKPIQSEHVEKPKHLVQVDQRVAMSLCQSCIFMYIMLYNIYIYIWVNYNDLTATSLEIMVSKRNHPKMALFQVSELL